MSEPVIFIATWIVLALAFGLLAITNRISETALIGSIAFLIGVGLMWVVHAGDRAAALKWRDGGQQVAIACGHTSGCIGWLQWADADRPGDPPGQAVWLALCADAAKRGLFGGAVPCSEER